ncbi:MAG: peptidase [Rhodospirillales bacterium]
MDVGSDFTEGTAEADASAASGTLLTQSKDNETARSAEAADRAETPPRDAGEAARPQDGGDAGERDADGKADDQSIDGAQITLPEGLEPNDQALEAFVEQAREMGLDQAKAQMLVDLYGKQVGALVERQQQALVETELAWRTAVEADKEIGGDKLEANLGIAKAALDRFGTPGLAEVLAGGLGSNPEIVRFMVAVGKAIGDDKHIVTGQGGGQALSQEERDRMMFPKTYKE